MNRLCSFLLQGHDRVLFSPSIMRNQVAEFALADMSGKKEAAPIGGPRGELKRVERVRKMFPETWMWYNGTVRYVMDME